MIDIISLLSTDGYVMCNKKLIKLYGADCAILVGELCAEYNYYKNINELTPADSFYSTQSNIEENTGLNAHAQRKALSILREAEIIKVTKMGLPAKNYYWINKDKLLNIFMSSPSNFEPLDVKNLNLNNNNKEKELNNKDNISKDILSNTESDYESHSYSPEDFLNTKKVKPKQQRKTLYQKCYDSCCNFTKNAITLNMLDEYLKLRLQMKDKPLYGVAQWDKLLDKLYQIAGTEDFNQQLVIKQSIERGWASFFELQTTKGNKKNVFSEGDGISSESASETVDERRARGVKAY